ncbi:hypothetical protein [Corynebacterium pygosceleis]|uniref:Uncharacterized protein n=1 Tax=Corynebacterium pygosceleis TaxID=2800406 RepID=A0A9Q4C838_9CORY|nr:hypothetical protein [Corynebacterium pygosceleis]MCK7637958.1 hypothetical protein [Corynebacterium pygosceleis]MCK7675673.1 hypothetical protein [Corynebacterium pygosceleis]MCX7468674.1 hypothetical protein [Corynebacterium pygosceleis]
MTFIRGCPSVAGTTVDGGRQVADGRASDRGCRIIECTASSRVRAPARGVVPEGGSVPRLDRFPGDGTGIVPDVGFLTVAEVDREGMFREVIMVRP